MKIYDSHLHTEHSHDGKFSIDELAKAAIKKGLKGITITDHFDSDIYETEEDFKHIYKSLDDIKNAIGKYELEIYKGVELGDWMFNPGNGNHCIETCDFDFILASIHSKAQGRRIIEGFEGYKSFLDTTYEEDKLFIKEYYKSLKYTAENADYDAIAHFSYPLRYLNGMCNKNMNLNDSKKDIEDILEILISKEKALEINTSGFKSSFNDTMPYKEIIQKYYDMGGRMITMGSDSHTTEHIAIGFDKTFEMLKEIGFKEYYFYKERKPVPVSII